MEKKLVHNCNKRGVQFGKSKKSIDMEGGNVCGGSKKIKINKCVSIFIRQMSVSATQLLGAMKTF